MRHDFDRVVRAEQALERPQGRVPERLGVDSVWTAEFWGVDAFTPLAAVAAVRSCTSCADRSMVFTPAANPASMNSTRNSGMVPKRVSSPYPMPKPIPRPATSSMTIRHASCACE